MLLYDRLAKSLVKQDKLDTDNTLIRKSRDTNNQAKVKTKAIKVNAYVGVAVMAEIIIENPAVTYNIELTQC